MLARHRGSLREHNGRPRASRPTGEPIGRGELKAVSPLIKVIDRLDKHQETVVAKHTYGPEER